MISVSDKYNWDRQQQFYPKFGQSCYDPVNQLFSLYAGMTKVTVLFLFIDYFSLLMLLPEFHVKTKFPSFTSNWRRYFGNFPILYHFHHHLENSIYTGIL